MRIIEYQTYREEEILPLYASVGWTAYTDAPDALRRGFERSLLTLAAYEEKTLVGLARAMMDRFANVRQFQLLTDDTEKTLAFYRSLGLHDLSSLGCQGFMR